MKKIYLLLGLVGLAVVNLTGCNKDDDYEESEELNFTVSENVFESYSAENPVSIKFYQTTSESTSYGKNLKQYVDAFQEQFPFISVEMTQPGGYDEIKKQIKTELAVGAGPNIAFCYADHVASYNKTKKVTHLDDLIDCTYTVKDVNGEDYQIGLTDEEKADFMEGYYNEGKQFGNEHMYTLPFLKSTEILYYDKTAFTSMGLEVPTHWFSTSDTDTTSMEYVCKTIKELHPNDTALGYDSEANWFITMCAQYGSDYTTAQEPYFTFNNDTNKGFVKTFRKWHKDGWVETGYTYGNGSSSYTSGLFTQSDSTKPRCYMCIGSSAGASHQTPDNNRFEVGVAPIPQIGDSKKAISQGPSVCIFQKDDPAEVVASWLLLKYLDTSVEFQAEYSMNSGYVPVLKSVQTNPTYSDFLNETSSDAKTQIAADAAKLCMEMSDYYFTSPAFLGSSDARTVVQGLFYNCLIAENESDIDTLFNDAISECNYAII